MRKPKKPTGYVLYENTDIVVIATLKSTNEKTGNMVQVWILCRDVDPVEAIKRRLDKAVCVDCKHMGTGLKDRTCYVQVAKAPLGIWKAYKRGRYPYLPIEGYAAIFGGRKVRLGAYGEPVLIPIESVAQLTAVSNGWTGYTHQWSNPQYAAYSAYVMASCDTVPEFLSAKQAGWRTFRVRAEGTPLMTNEITCPASEEAGKRTTCENCKLCSGTYNGDTRKDITLLVHGANKGKFIQIGVAA